MPGDQSFDPPPEQQGTGKPGDATSVTCSEAKDCDYWYCRCEDGAVVNSALCVNGFCMNAAAACPRACEYFDHGAWTGQAGGGPGTTPTPPTCGGLGSDKLACDTCLRDQCCDEARTCGTNSSCLSYWDCVLACDGSPSCQLQCDDAYPTGAAPYEGLRDCLLDSCYAQCVGEL
ncbi:MAG: hypothetical protein M3680_18050 [Myxococcota bacterium]|nr:hypothetical protein [Myxococcota bacterium]